jgi:thioredoxin reductase (NADPH)
VVLAGGGDSALDWTIFLADIASRVTLVHRGDTFRGAPDSAEKVFELAEKGKIDLILQSQVNSLGGNGVLKEVSILGNDKSITTIPTDHFIPLFGLSPKFGPIADWKLGVEKSAVTVNTFDYSTNVERIYAIGDINTYPGKAQTDPLRLS